MEQKIRIDLHCHSCYSDGKHEPSELASELASQGILYAALTDHDSIEGTQEFENACSKLGLTALSGLEWTTSHLGQEIHLLGYGFDPLHPSLKNEIHPTVFSGNSSHDGVNPRKKMETIDAIRFIHDAGGLAVLAHPLLSIPFQENLQQLISELSIAGLDGLEVYRPDVSPEQVGVLTEIANRNNLILSGGSDYHGPGSIGSSLPAIIVDKDIWLNFRNAVIKRQNAYQNSIKTTSSVNRATDNRKAIKNSFVPHIVLPTSASLILFILTLAGFFLPYFEKTLMDRKKEEIRDLTHVVRGVLQEAHQRALSGLATFEEARKSAKESVRSLRYGTDNKDYFWLQDTHPRMIMHPYRTDLEGKDLSDFKDPRGERIFVLFAESLLTNSEAIVSYVWQWKDDPARLEAKESCIILFKPWNWIIGTGIYTHDIQSEISKLKANLIWVITLLVSITALLLMYVVRESWKSEKSRQLAEKGLFESNQRYQLLAKAALEGALFVQKGQCRYGNPVMLELAGCEERELKLLNWEDLFPATAPNQALYQYYHTLINDGAAGESLPAMMQRRNGGFIECRVTLRPFSDGLDHDGIIFLVRDFEPKPSLDSHPLMFLRDALKTAPLLIEDLVKQIESVRNIHELSLVCARTPSLTSSLMVNGVSISVIIEAITSITDAAVIKLIKFAQEEFGPPPADYAFIAMGSQGRKEQTLFTDQDNAILYSDPDGKQDNNAYFLKLGEYVCDGLKKAGFIACKGGVMAENPRWCKPFSVWKTYFENWIETADKMEIMEFSIFFDLRCVVGNRALVEKLRDSVLQKALETPIFLTGLAENALSFKAPLRIFGSIVSSASHQDQAGALDLKAAMLPIIAYARLYSIKYNIKAISTGKRLEELVVRGFLLPAKYQDISTAYEALMRIRLRSQIKKVETGSKLDNLLVQDIAGHIEEAILKECFKEIDSIQNAIKYDFNCDGYSGA